MRIIHQEPGRIVIADPPYQLLGWIFLGVAVFALVLCFLAKYINDKPTHPLMCAVATVPFAVVGLWLSGTARIINASSSAQGVSLETTWFGVGITKRSVPFNLIRGAVVESEGDANRLSLLLKSGELVPTSDTFTNEPGHHAAAAALNRFLTQPER